MGISRSLILTLTLTTVGLTAFTLRCQPAVAFNLLHKTKGAPAKTPDQKTPSNDTKDTPPALNKPFDPNVSEEQPQPSDPTPAEKMPEKIEQPVAEPQPAAPQAAPDPNEINVDDEMAMQSMMPGKSKADSPPPELKPEPGLKPKPELKRELEQKPDLEQKPHLETKSKPKPKRPALSDPDFERPLPVPVEKPATKQVKDSPSKDEPTPPSTQPKSKLTVRSDISGQFSYVVPDGWLTYAIPMQPHEVLSMREGSEIKATVSFAHKEGKGDIEKIKNTTLDESKAAFTKFVVVEDKIENLPNGQPCARMITTEEIDETPTRQVQYVLNPRKKYFLVVTMTVSQPVGKKYDKVLLHIVNSITSGKTP